MPRAFADHFSGHAARYAAARPTYPATLFHALAERAPARGLAWDVGTGNGQAALGLAAEFAEVRAIDASEAQLAAAEPHPRVRYALGREGMSGLGAGSVDLVAAAQAAHWFDHAAFHAEVRRVLRPGGVVACWCYTLPRVDPAVDAVVDWFYADVVGPWWPPERATIMRAYADLPFPFPEEPFPEVAMSLEWTRDALLEYIGTWSAVHRCRADGGEAPMRRLTPRLAAAWPEADASRVVRWPLHGRLGRLPRSDA